MFVCNRISKKTLILTIILHFVPGIVFAEAIPTINILGKWLETATSLYPTNLNKKKKHL